MQITPHILTLKQLLGTSNEQFIVPGYQRRYAWGRKQHAALFDDLNFLKENDNHLLGMIICHNQVHKAGLNKSELVDGQQRLTTITLMLYALLKKFEQLNLQNKIQEIKSLIYSYDQHENKLNKIELGDLDNPDYKNILNGEDDSSIVNKNLWEAFKDYSSWLLEFNKDEVIFFYNKLINVAVINRLDVGFAKDAYKLFETINNRGLRLSPTDIIKNFILGHASKIDETTLEKVKKLWSEIIISLDGIDNRQFLRQYMCMILQKRITLRKLVEEFKAFYINNIENTQMLSESELYSDEEEEQDEEAEDFETGELEENANNTQTKNITEISVIDFLKSLRDAALVYRKIRFREFDEQKINQSLLNLQRILAFPSYILLLDILRRDIKLKDKLAILKIIETFMLRRHICQKRTSRLDIVFSQLVSLNNNNIATEMKNILELDLPTDEEFETDFPKFIFKGKLVDRARYILEQIEYHLINDKGEYKLSNSNDVHIEHIIPQTITTKKAKKEFGDWVDYLGENAAKKHKSYVSRIGNLTLISGELNIKASNNPFLSKKDNYKLSNLRLNDSLSNHYRQFKFQQVEERGKELANIAVGIWKF